MSLLCSAGISDVPDSSTPILSFEFFPSIIAISTVLVTTHSNPQEEMWLFFPRADFPKSNPTDKKHLLQKKVIEADLPRNSAARQSQGRPSFAKRDP